MCIACGLASVILYSTTDLLFGYKVNTIGCTLTFTCILKYAIALSTNDICMLWYTLMLSSVHTLTATGVEGRFGITPVAGRVGGVILINRIVLYLQLL